MVLRPPTAPAITSASFAAVAITEVVSLLAVPPAVSITAMVNVVVTVLPGATWCAVGVNTSPSIASVTTGDVPAIIIRYRC